MSKLTDLMRERFGDPETLRQAEGTARTDDTPANIKARRDVLLGKEK